MTFSVNTPSPDLLKETDYCGLVSGRDADKAAVCGFEVFYGELETAPLIEQCPLNLECRVVHMLNLGMHCLVIGQVEGSHISEEYLTDGKPDIDRINPVVFCKESAAYFSVGDFIGKAFGVGRELKEKK